MAEEIVLYCGIVTFNGHKSHLEKCLQSIERSRIQSGIRIYTGVLDNNSSNQEEIVNLCNERGAEIYPLSLNIGYAAGHNTLMGKAAARGAKYYLALNSDLVLEEDFFLEILKSGEKHPDAGFITPLLCRADSELNPDGKIDAAGMILTPSFRHFDRFSGENIQDKNLKEEEVFGGTGAALLINLKNVRPLLLNHLERAADGFFRRVYPQLLLTAKERFKLFDEAFFAYREDAELACRAAVMGIKTYFCPIARGYHFRSLKDEEKRGVQSSIVRKLGVKNRFLLQKNCSYVRFTLFQKILINFRNLIVYFGVILKERDIIDAFKEYYALKDRCRVISGYFDKVSINKDAIKLWMEKN